MNNSRARKDQLGKDTGDIVSIVPERDASVSKADSKLSLQSYLGQHYGAIIKRESPKIIFK